MELKLRDYQSKTLEDIFEWFKTHEKGNPCVVLPTGSGKSIIIAEFCRICATLWPGTRILILTHQKELIEQDAIKLKKIYKDADIGIYSAALKKKETNHTITFGGIQSIYKIDFPKVDIILVDEAHMINHKNEGMYRKFLNKMGCRVIGLTATPFRLTFGYITDEPALFTDLIEPKGTSILELQKKGYLAKLSSKGTFTKLDVTGVKKSGGDYVKKDLQIKLDVFETNEAVVKEIIITAKAFNKKHWLIFCTGVDHARHISDLLNDSNIKSNCITGDLKKNEREQILEDFTKGKYTALTNVNVLTTGFDYPDIDMLILLRPTESVGLYLQMAGRGLRLKSDGGYCLVMDFAGVVEKHGPITHVIPPSKKRETKGEGVAPCKECPECFEIIQASVRKCPNCGYIFPKKTITWRLFDGDINGDGSLNKEVTAWLWTYYESKTSGKPVIMATYYTQNTSYREWFCLFHEGWIQRKALSEIKYICHKVDLEFTQDPLALINDLNTKSPPAIIALKMKNKYPMITKRFWADDVAAEIKKQKEMELRINENRVALLGADLSV